MNVHDDSYKDLASAIVGQACKDYVAGLHKKEVEIFLKSEWFTSLTDMDGRKLLEGLKEIVKEKELKKRNKGV